MQWRAAASASASGAETSGPVGWPPPRSARLACGCCLRHSPASLSGVSSALPRTAVTIGHPLPIACRCHWRIRDHRVNESAAAGRRGKKRAVSAKRRATQTETRRACTPPSTIRTCNGVHSYRFVHRLGGSPTCLSRPRFPFAQASWGQICPHRERLFGVLCRAPRWRLSMGMCAYD